MGGSRRYYAKWNRSEKDKYCMISLICRIQKKQNEQTKQNENRLIDADNKLVPARGEEVK